MNRKSNRHARSGKTSLYPRRRWMTTTAGLTAGFWLGGSTAQAKRLTANEKLNLAFVGVGGRGSANLNGLRRHNLVAFCDVDNQRAKQAFETYPNVPRFKDYRRMLDALENKIDGVVISTPDHTHFHPAYQALQMGKHLYLEKPLAHNLWETRTLCELARDKKVATQLGVQRHTLPNIHRVVEAIQAGAIGDVLEVYCWVGGKRGMPSLPKYKGSIPSHLDYELWLGPASRMDYHPSVTPYGWRFWWNFGTGETGNWGCHILDIPFWALGLKHPKSVSARGPMVDPLRTPQSMSATLVFPNPRGGRDIKLHWGHLEKGPAILEQLKMPHDGHNTLFVGTDGYLLAGFGKMKLYPEEKFRDWTNNPTIPDSPGFYREWVDACKGNEKATCNFEYSGPLAETVLLANLAYRSQVDFDWDANNLNTNSEEANQFLKKRYRSGWEI